MRRSGGAVLMLAFCLGGCGARGGNAAAGGSNGAARAAVAAAAPCPFETRNIRAVVENDEAGEPRVSIHLEHFSDPDRRHPVLLRRLEPPPDHVLDLESNPQGYQTEAREWGESGMGGYEATADFTHAVVRCRGVPIARVPIRR